VRGEQPLLGGAHVAARVAVEDARVGGEEGVHVGGRRLPRRGRAEEHPHPGLREQLLAEVVPGGGEQAGGAEPLRVAREVADVRERDAVVGVEAPPVAHPRRRPRLHPGVAEGATNLS
jgi:hypothetical protein